MKYILQFGFTYCLKEKLGRKFAGWGKWSPEIVWVIMEKQYNEPSRPLEGEFVELFVWGNAHEYEVTRVTHLTKIPEGHSHDGIFTDSVEFENRRVGPLAVLEDDISHIPLDAHEPNASVWRENRRNEILCDTTGLFRQGFWIHDASWNYDPNLRKNLGYEGMGSTYCPRCLHRHIRAHGAVLCHNCGLEA